MNSALTEPLPRAVASSGGIGLAGVPVRTPRKRRRPALSCVQCRRRKVKCDRNLPCTQCSQYNTATSAACRYDDPEVTAKGQSSYFTRHVSHDIRSIPPPDSIHGIPRLNSNAPIQNGPAPVLSGFERRSPGSSVPWVPPPPAEYSRSEQHASVSSVRAATPQSETSIQELKERVRKLEEIISTSSNYAQGPTEAHPWLSKPNIPKSRGNIDKTRFFGMSHWMNTYDEV
jgi:Fungal Zn(2)-Cys(6) binuclear cluster domain